MYLCKHRKKTQHINHIPPAFTSNQNTVHFNNNLISFSITTRDHKSILSIIGIAALTASTFSYVKLLGSLISIRKVLQSGLASFSIAQAQPFCIMPQKHVIPQSLLYSSVTTSLLDWQLQHKPGLRMSTCCGYSEACRSSCLFN